jgi:hypothetical protein
MLIASLTVYTYQAAAFVGAKRLLERRREVHEFIHPTSFTFGWNPKDSTRNTPRRLRGRCNDVGYT